MLLGYRWNLALDNAIEAANKCVNLISTAAANQMRIEGDSVPIETIQPETVVYYAARYLGIEDTERFNTAVEGLLVFVGMASERRDQHVTT